jgi:acetolactate synthase-1/2/3 large subunit
LEALADYLEAPELAIEEKPPLPAMTDGPITAESVNTVIANLLPENTVVSDEGATSLALSFGLFDSAANHDWLTLTGGAIGQGLPVALGAAVACPDRKVLALQADGSGMYTNQALWSMARENLDVCVVIYNNSSYAILNMELMRVGVTNPGERARSMLDLSNPEINWANIGEGMGVKSSRVTTTEAFRAQFEEAMACKGPRLIEVVLPGGLQWPTS